MAGLPPPPNLMLLAVRACGVPDLPLYLGQGPAERVFSEIFKDDFTTCKNLTREDLNNSFKSYSSFRIANERISFNPLQKKRLHALVE